MKHVSIDMLTKHVKWLFANESILECELFLLITHQSYPNLYVTVICWRKNIQRQKLHQLTHYSCPLTHFIPLAFFYTPQRVKKKASGIKCVKAQEQGGCSYQHCTKKWSFTLRISSVNVTTFTEKVLNGKLHFFTVQYFKNSS